MKVLNLQFYFHCFGLKWKISTEGCNFVLGQGVIEKVQ